jgi:hypothetical protein
LKSEGFAPASEREQGEIAPDLRQNVAVLIEYARDIGLLILYRIKTPFESRVSLPTSRRSADRGTTEHDPRTRSQNIAQDAHRDA